MTDYGLGPILGNPDSLPEIKYSVQDFEDYLLKEDTSYIHQIDLKLLNSLSSKLDYVSGINNYKTYISPSSSSYFI